MACLDRRHGRPGIWVGKNRAKPVAWSGMGGRAFEMTCPTQIRGRYGAGTWLLTAVGLATLWGIFALAWWGGKSDLHYAAYDDDRAAIAGLVAASAGVNGRDAYGWTPLHVAAYMGYEEVARALLKAGADPDLRSKQGCANTSEQ